MGEKNNHKNMKKQPLDFRKIEAIVHGIECPEDRLLMGIMLYLGPRVSEVRDLTTDEIKAWGDYGYLRQLKRRAVAKRLVPIPDVLQEIIKECLPNIEHGYAFKSNSNNGIGDGCISRQGIDHRIKKYFGSEVSAHSLRKTVGKFVYEQLGNDIARASMFLGHKNPSSTYHYLGTSEETIRGIF